MTIFVISDIGCLIVGIMLKTISNDLAWKITYDILIFRCICIDDQCAVSRKELCETAERMTDIINVLEEIQMICIHVQDNADFREKAQKTICIFACFCDKSFRFTYTDISADCRKNPTNTDGRIAVTCKKNMRYHRCCSSFSMCSGNCDRCVVISHDLSKKFCTGKHRNTFFFSTGKLRIVRMNGCGINDYIYTFSNVGCTLSVVDSCSFFLKCLCKRA